MGNEKSTARTASLWISHLVWLRKRELKGHGWFRYLGESARTKIRRWAFLVARPSLAALGVAALGGLLLLVLAYVLSLQSPERRVPSAYLALWQLQAALGFAALPILIFIISLSGEGRNLRQPQIEVLAWRTFAFPIQFFVLGVVLVFGMQMIIFPTALSVELGLMMFAISLCFTAFAFYHLLKLLFDRGRLRDAGDQLLVERFKESLEQSVDRRLGANLMLEWIDRHGWAYSPVSLPGTRDDYIAIEAPQAGTIVDVHLGRLSQLLATLPERREPGVAEVQTDLPSTAGSDEVVPRQDESPSHPFVFRKLFGETIHPASMTVFEFSSTVFPDLDPETVGRALGQALKIQ